MRGFSAFNEETQAGVKTEVSSPQSPSKGSPFGRVYLSRFNGDVCVGGAVVRSVHLRAFGIEESAAIEALRLRLLGKEPPRATMRVFQVNEGVTREATAGEAE